LKNQLIVVNRGGLGRSLGLVLYWVVLEFHIKWVSLADPPGGAPPRTVERLAMM
jgi:hypothetical protein